MTKGKVGIHLIQMRVGWDAQENADLIARLLEGARPGDIAVTPEGSVSGYPATGEADDLSRIETRKVYEALNALELTAKTRGVVLWTGIVRKVGNSWCNEAVELRFGERRTYRKCNLANWERNHFTPGMSLPTFDVGAATVGVQICRELRFAEQWLGLALTGAQVLIHLNHAAGAPRMFDVWRSMLVSRAHETQRWVVSANAADPHQHSPTIVVAPSGEVLLELEPHRDAAARVELDLGAVRDDYLSQRAALTPTRS